MLCSFFSFRAYSRLASSFVCLHTVLHTYNLNFPAFQPISFHSNNCNRTPNVKHAFAKNRNFYHELKGNIMENHKMHHYTNRNGLQKKSRNKYQKRGNIKLNSLLISVLNIFDRIDTFSRMNDGTRRAQTQTTKHTQVYTYL